MTIDGGVIRNVTFDGLAISEFNDGTSNNVTVNNSVIETGTMKDYEIFLSVRDNSDIINSIANNVTVEHSTINTSSINNSVLNQSVIDCGTF